MSGQAGAGRGRGALGPGAVVAGYRIEQQIGRGGMAVVYRAQDERLGRSVALKVLAPALKRNSEFRARFIRESRAAAAVDHPNILPLYDAGESDGYLFIAMRYVPGGDARSLLREAGPLPADRVTSIVGQIGAALDAAHASGLVHRDVKPANMLLERLTAGQGRPPGTSDSAAHAYLTDFGVSKQMEVAGLTATGQIVGTLDYVAPEQIEARALDGRADQYSLACASFELLGGTPPFRRRLSEATIYAQLAEPPPPLAAIRPGLPPAVDQVLARALAKVPGQRYATCSQFAAQLAQALSQPGTRAERPRTPVMPPGAPARRRGIEPPTRRLEK